MTKYVWKHLPFAVYIDTNVLRSAGPSLNKQWMSELLSLINEYGISLCISELVVQEWCEHISKTLESNRQKLFSSISLLKDYNIKIPNIEPHEANLPEKPDLVEIVTHKLKNSGFTIIKNWDGPLSQLLTEAVEKYPPFEQGGKGFCDAVILESYVKHAVEIYSEARVLVVSNDSAVKRSEKRFKKHGIAVEFVVESEIVEKLKSLLKDEVATYNEEKDRLLEEYILSHAVHIREYINTTPIEITKLMLEGHLTKDEDKIYGTIERILSVKPTQITKVVGGAPTYGEETPQDRYPIQIFVEIEIDIIVSQYGSGTLTEIVGLLQQPLAVVQPDMIDRDSPVTLKRGTRYQLQEITKTIKRSITVRATIDAGQKEKDVFDDFRIENII